MIRRKKKGIVSRRKRRMAPRRRVRLRSIHTRHKDDKDDKYTREELLSKNIDELEVICDIWGIEHKGTAISYRPPTPPKGTISRVYEYAVFLVDKILECEAEEKGATK